MTQHLEACSGVSQSHRSNVHRLIPADQSTVILTNQSYHTWRAAGEVNQIEVVVG